MKRLALVLVETVGLENDVELSIEIGFGVSLLVKFVSPRRTPLGFSMVLSVFWTGSASRRIQCTLFFFLRMRRSRF